MKEMIKPIQLTKEQKSELINLCNKTWPDYKFHANFETLYYTTKQNDFLLNIHWFEFVVRMAIDEERDEFMNFYLNVCSTDESK